MERMKEVFENANMYEVVTSHGSPASTIQLALSEHGRLDSVVFVIPTYEQNDVCTRDRNREWSDMRAGDLDAAFDVCTAWLGIACWTSTHFY